MHGRYLPLFLLLTVSTSVFAQEATQPRPSPTVIASCKYKDTYLKIVYGQPHKKGREIFGKLVPFGAVWRTGANEATEITISRDVFVNAQLLPAGTYAVFTIPDKEKWTIIFNKELGQWGSYNYNQARDVLRIEAVPQSLSGEQYFEPFTISIDQKNNKADINLMWDTTKVSFAVDFIEPKP